MEDLLYHEAAHFITFEGCKSWADFVIKERMVREEYIPGISKYNDVSSDGAETIAEAFVAMKNGENIPIPLARLVKKYIGRKKIMSCILSKCAECKHFDSEKEKLACTAFPDGIPLEVFKSTEDYPCTEKISFEREVA